MPVGADDLHGVDDIVAGIRGMRTRRGTLTEAIVKLNEGVSGAGNAVVDLHGLPAPGSPPSPRRSGPGCSRWSWRPTT